MLGKDSAEILATGMAPAVPGMRRRPSSNGPGPIRIDHRQAPAEPIDTPLTRDNPEPAMPTVVLTIHLLIALALIIVVLLQRSEGGGLGIGGGGGGGIMSGRSAATALSKVTWALGTAFVITSIALTVFAARDAGTGSVVDRGAISGGEADGPVVPGLGNDLLPPIPSDGPTAPPAAD
jgi:preprotein translocase subunit SecG